MSCQDPPARGRPRDPEVESRILRAALELLERDGFTRMSLEDVAARAGVSKPTIYRRWSGKADLATAAVSELRMLEPAARGRSTVERLTSMLQNFRKSLLRPNGMALIGTVLSEEVHNPELLSYFRARLVEPRRRLLAAELETARTRGELRPDCDVSCAVNMLVGAFYALYLAGTPIRQDEARRIVDVVWRGVAQRE